MDERPTGKRRSSIFEKKSHNATMKLTLNLKLQPTKEQARCLCETMTLTNQACDAISEMAWNALIFNQYDLHKVSYKIIRDSFGLSAQMVIRCIAKVANAYKLDKKRKRKFRRYGAIAYDERIISFKKDERVSLWTTEGRQPIPFVCGEYQRKMLPKRHGEVYLIYRQGNFYLNAVCNIDEPDIKPAPDVLGVDLGIINIATDSDGHIFST